jgi:hypothetical protein
MKNEDHERLLPDRWCQPCGMYYMRESARARARARENFIDNQQMTEGR